MRTQNPGQYTQTRFHRGAAGAPPSNTPLFTRYGFYSIACARQPGGALDLDLVMVRARDREHLRALQARFPELANFDIIPTPSRDYGYRLVVSKAVWARILHDLAMEQEWSNFKDEAAAHQRPSGSEYVRALHDVWQRMARLQRSAPRSDRRAALNRMIAAVGKVAPNKMGELDQMKQRAADWEHPDFIWEALLLSMATMGNSRGVKLTRDKDFHDRVRWRALAELNAAARRSTLEKTLREAGVRMAGKKAHWLDENFTRIAGEGGPEAVKCGLQRQPGRDGKIAIDERIKAFADRLGLSFSTYEDGERFYLEVAHAAGLSGWELDRLLYNFADDVTKALDALPMPT